MTEKKINYTLPSHRAQVAKAGNKVYVAYDSCETPDEGSATAEQEGCYQNCLISNQCREVVEMDI